MGLVCIVEGVAGSGKDSLVDQLVHRLDSERRPVYVFQEEALLASWLHYRLANIDSLRLDLAASLVDRMASELASDDEAAFVLNRFHVSYAVWRQEKGAANEFAESHRLLVAKLRLLPVVILHATLPAEVINDRSSHLERSDLAWKQFRAWRLNNIGGDSVGASYLAQQHAMTTIIAEDRLPYRTVVVDRDRSIDLDWLQT
jgi:thymidylate kinase